MLNEKYVLAFLAATEDEPHRRDYAAVWDNERGQRMLATADGAVALDPVYELEDGEEYSLQPAVPITIRRDERSRYFISTDDDDLEVYPGEDPVEIALAIIRDWGVTFFEEEDMQPPPGHGLRRDDWGRWWYGKAILPHGEEHTSGDIIGTLPDGRHVTFAREVIRDGLQYYSWRRRLVRNDWGKARKLYEAFASTASVS